MKQLGRALVIAALALIGTLALLTVNVDLSASANATDLLRGAFASLSGKEALGALVFAALVALYARTLFTPLQWRRGDWFWLAALGLLFAAAASLGAAYRADDGSLAGFPARAHLLYVSFKALGFFTLFLLSMKALLQSLPKLALRLPVEPAPSARAVRRVFWIAWALLLVAWLPSFLARYPGALSADAGRVLQQYTGEIMWTSDHPPAYTLLLGSLVTLGARIAGDAFGLFLYTALQALFLAGAMAFSLAELRREGVPRYLRYGLTVLYALLPMAMGSAAHVIKDIPYAAAFLIYCVLVARAMLHTPQAMSSVRWWLGYGFSALFLLLIRHNGMLIVLPMAVVLLVCFLHASHQSRRLLTALLPVPVVLALLFNTLVVPQLAYQPESTPDVLGVAFQQTARILKNSPQDATPADLATLDRILEANTLGMAYTPKGSDPVRKLYRYFDNHTAQDVLSAMGVWARLSCEHPLTAFHAAWSLNGGYLDPFDTTQPKRYPDFGRRFAKIPASLFFHHARSVHRYANSPHRAGGGLSQASAGFGVGIRRFVCMACTAYRLPDWPHRFAKACVADATAPHDAVCLPAVRWVYKRQPVPRCPSCTPRRGCLRCFFQPSSRIPIPKDSLSGFGFTD